MHPNRIYTRHPITLSVQVRTLQGWQELQTADVSRVGLFVRTPAPSSVGQAVQLRIALPSGKTMELMAQVRQVAKDSTEHVLGPGMGLQFFAVAKEVADEWNAFITSLRPAPTDHSYAENSQTLRDRLPPQEVRDMLRKMRESGELRQPASNSRPLFVTITPSTVERLAAVASRAEKASNLFLRVTVPAEEGQRVRVALVHPLTDVEVTLGAVVRRVVTADVGEVAGVQAQFDVMDPSSLARLASFLAGEVPPLG